MELRSVAAPQLTREPEALDGVAANVLDAWRDWLAELETPGSVVQDAVQEVGFVGLLIPHAVRLLGVANHRRLLPLAVLLGGTFLTVADTLARTVLAPQQLPVGVLTALLGVPGMLILLGRRR